MNNRNDIIDVDTVQSTAVARADSLKTWGWVSYILHLIVAVGAVLPGAQVSIALLAGGAGEGVEADVRAAEGGRLCGCGASAGGDCGDGDEGANGTVHQMGLTCLSRGVPRGANGME